MAKADLTAERLREILHYDPETGIFTWKQMLAYRGKVGSVAGYTENRRGNRYITIRVSNCLYMAHRLAWLYVMGEWPVNQIDHINGDGADNRFVNLREATDQQNKQNMRASKASQSGLRGVYPSKVPGKWYAQITTNRKTRTIGQFFTKEDAYAAYLAERVKVHTFNPTVRQ